MPEIKETLKFLNIVYSEQNEDNYRFEYQTELYEIKIRKIKPRKK